MATLPTGTVTFLFTDIEGSTRLLEALGDRYAEALEAHRRMLRDAFAAHAGHVVDAQGDAFFVTFASAEEAVEASVAAQRALVDYSWPEGLSLRVRMGLHSGQGRIHDAGYVGIDVHRGARIASAGHGGQVLLSQRTRYLLGDDLGGGLGLRDLGEHRLKDLTSQRLYQLLIPGLESEFPALKTLENRPTNLPTQPTALIGRQHELAQADAMLRRNDVRLLTFTGPGGMGKTRLALQLSAEVLDEYPDGVFFVDLAAIVDPTLVVPTIAQTLAVREFAGRTVDEMLAEHLRGRRLLLVLDNFEQLLAGASSLAALLSAAPQLKLLVTSRAPLHLAAEHEYAVPPLELPDVEHLPEALALSQYEAVALFVERARTIRPEFVVTNANASAVAEICVRLDGLPLAIELAAAHVRALPPQALLRRLEQRLNVLTGGALDAPARQRTLRAAIDWSYALLDESEQRAFARLSVFEGGWDLAASEAVCDFDGGLGIEVLESISSLLEKSLVREEDDLHGEPRYSMLESIHEYAREKLEESSQAQAVRRRHAEHFLALAERALRTITGEEIAVSDAPEEQVQGELPNLRAALEWAFAEGEAEFIVRLTASSGWAWIWSGRLTEGRAWVTRALDATPQLPTRARAKALNALAGIEAGQGNFRLAGRIHEEALELFRRHDDGIWVFQTLGSLANIACATGDLERARRLSEEARGVADDLGSDYAQGRARMISAFIEDSAGDYERAQVLTEEGLALWRELGVPRRLWLHQLINIGWVALQEHDYARAKTALGEYLAEHSWKNPIGIANAHSNLGLVALYEGDRDAAASHFSESLTLARGAGARPTIAEGLYGLAAVAAMDGDAERAVRLWAAGDVMRDAMAAPLSAPELFIVQRYLDPVETRLASDARLSARAEASAMTMDEAVDLALAVLDRRGLRP